jgi:hypothetical protein
MSRRNSRLFAALLWTCAIAAAQPGVGQSANVSGVVVNSVTGQPVLRAHVLFSPMDLGAESYGAISDAGGKFSILRLPPGQYNVSVHRIGHLHLVPGPVTLQAGDETNDLKFSLIPAGYITGRVLGSEGAPVESASVQVVGPTLGNTTTDDRGQFRFSDLAAGRYKVQARPQEEFWSQEVLVDGSTDVHHAATYYPSSPDVRSAGRVTVTAGVETSGIEIRLVRSPMVRLSGVVTGFPAGAHGGMVHLMSQSPSPQKIAAVKPDGKFEITSVDSGHYQLYAATQDPKQFLQSAAMELEVTQSDIKDLELRVMAPFPISGVVQYEDEQAKPPERGQQHLRLWLQSASETNLGHTLSGGEIKADGSFTLEGVAPGRYVIGLSWQNGYVKSIQLGTQLMDGYVLDVSDGAAGAPLSLLVSSAFAEISGKVDGAADAPGRFDALAVPDPRRGPQTYSVKIGSDGSYRLAGLPPGKYKLGVVEKLFLGPPPEIDDPVEITLSAGEKSTKDLRLPPSQ